ncbi:lactonase family protein [Cellvibrio fontiphilus]|uniref:Lactonase family protein n=1 Tax=Cellvibrio fontiphilus TaxID=1815559 RepID=A0ABV7FEM5_9GAMM
MRYRSLHLLRSVKFLLLLWLGTAGIVAQARHVIYVANSDSHSISVFGFDLEANHLTLQQTVPVGGAVMPMALSSGELSPGELSLELPPGKSPGDKPLLYAATRSQPYQLLTFSIDPATGHLSERAAVPLTQNMANIALDASGRFLFAVSYSGNSLHLHPLNKQGVPLAESSVIPLGLHPHQVTADPANQFIYVSLLGSDRVDYFRLNKNASSVKTLEPAQTPALHTAPGSGPRHFVFSTTGEFLYLLNELAGSLQVYKRNARSGKASLLQSHLLTSATKKAWAADIHLTAGGRFIYATERSTSQLVGFSVDHRSGRLTPVGSWSTEQQPRAFSISPDGKWLAVVGQLSQRMSIYAIDQNSGQLRLLGAHSTGKNPAWVEIVELPKPAP